MGSTAENKSLRRSALGAGLTVACGLILWATPLGDSWTNASYDYLFRFGSRPVTNAVTLILMDNAAFDQFHQTRGQPWDRALHAQLLNKLADDGCALVAMDSFFRAATNAPADTALAAAMRRQQHLVLMAEQSPVTHPGLVAAQPTLPAQRFLDAAQTNWGVAWLNPDLDGIVRRHWPFPSPGPYPSLPQTAATLYHSEMETGLNGVPSSPGFQPPSPLGGERDGVRGQSRLLRTHTSSVQIRVMKQQPPPVRIIVPGRVYRRDNADATHNPTFHQIEGLYVDKNVTVGDLKGTVEFVFRELMGSDVKIRFRPHYFSYTEPSYEIDFTNALVKKMGKDWLEIAGCGMVHPQVFENVGYDPEVWTGWAFGFGIERIAMLRYGINDIRLFYENDVRFLKQF